MNKMRRAVNRTNIPAEDFGLGETTRTKVGLPCSKAMLKPRPPKINEHPLNRDCAGDVAARALNKCMKSLAPLTDIQLVTLADAIGDYAESALCQWSPEYLKLHHPRKKKK
jgi:hypothetical protein